MEMDEDDKIPIRRAESSVLMKRIKTSVLAQMDLIPRGMLATGYTSVFPREDNIFKKKESLAFDES